MPPPPPSVLPKAPGTSPVSPSKAGPGLGTASARLNKHDRGLWQGAPECTRHKTVEGRNWGSFWLPCEWLQQLLCSPWLTSCKCAKLCRPGNTPGEFSMVILSWTSMGLVVTMWQVRRQIPPGTKFAVLRVCVCVGGGVLPISTLQKRDS